VREGLPQPVYAIGRAPGAPLDRDALREAMLPWVEGLCFVVAALIVVFDHKRCEAEAPADGATAAATLAPVMASRQGRAKAGQFGDCRRSGRRMPG
jgi:hypothetical protein